MKIICNLICQIDNEIVLSFYALCIFSLRSNDLKIVQTELKIHEAHNIMKMRHRFGNLRVKLNWKGSKNMIILFLYTYCLLLYYLPKWLHFHFFACLPRYLSTCLSFFYLIYLLRPFLPFILITYLPVYLSSFLV